MEGLSQEEIEQLVSGTLSEERGKEVLSSDDENETVNDETQDVYTDEQQIEESQQEIADSSATAIEENTKKSKEAIKAEKEELKKQKKLEKEAAKKAKKEKKENKKSSTETLDENKKTEKKENAIVSKVVNMPTKILMIALIVMATLVVLMGSAMGITLYRKNKLEVATKVKVSVPSYNANATNFIFISQEKEFEGATLKLVKMLADPVATIFYFDKSLDFMSYEADLKDSRGKIYNMDISFAESSNAEVTNAEYSFVRFEPLEINSRQFTVTVSNPNTGEKVDYSIRLDSQIQSSPVKYLPEPIKTTAGEQNIEIALENSIFSSSGSIIEYRLKWNNKSDTIKMGWKGTSSSNLISIEEGGIVVPTTRKYPATYSFTNDNTVIGRMDFEKVRNLNSNIKIKFDDLFEQTALNQSIDISDLPYKADETNQKIIQIDDSKLILENFGQFEDECILTYHGIDTLDNRVEIKLDIDLSIVSDSGMEVVIPGECISQKEGGNIMFNTKNSEELLGKIIGQKYVLNLKNVGVKIPTQTINLDLSKLSATKAQTDKSQAEDFIIEAFEKRLSVKSGEIESSELQNYFNIDIIKDESISMDYTKNSALTEPAQYSSQVLTIAENDDGVYFAAVQDFWKGKENIKETHFYRTHKITVENVEGKYRIIEDNILK